MCQIKATYYLPKEGCGPAYTKLSSRVQTLLAHNFTAFASGKPKNYLIGT
jgi:hypothetical protein